MLEQGDILTFVNEECEGTKDKIYMSYEHFAADVNIGERVLIDDGKLVLEVVETNQKRYSKTKSSVWRYTLFPKGSKLT